MSNSAALCPDEELRPLLDKASQSPQEGLAQAEILLRAYANDPRLSFLRGSLLAQLDRHEEARRALRETLEIAPNYAVARFQLGLMELSGGDAYTAFAVWGPLALLKEETYLSQFVRGLQHMVRDEFDPAIELLTSGIAANSELPPMNNDMRLLIDEMQKRQRTLLSTPKPVAHQSAAESAEADEPTSMTQFLLQQFRNKNKLH